jgi:hypothetical protein
MLGMTTIKILRGRVNYLMHENGVLRREIVRLRRENTRLRKACEVFDFKPDPEPPVTAPDYGLGGHEWVDPISGIDSCDGKQGAD